MIVGESYNLNFFSSTNMNTTPTLLLSATWGAALLQLGLGWGEEEGGCCGGGRVVEGGMKILHYNYECCI